MYSSLRSSLNVGRCQQSTFKHFRINRLRGEGRLPFKWSQFTGICTFCLSWDYDSQLQNGVWPCSISQMSIPKAQTSVFGPYMLLIKPSGAIQAGDPMLTSLNSRLQWVAKPKSPIFALPFNSKMLAALISRCTILIDSRYNNPWKTSLMMEFASFTSSLSPRCPFLIRFARSPSSQNQQIVQQLLTVRKYSIHETTLGCFNLLTIFNSSQNSCSMPISCIFLSSTIFTATCFSPIRSTPEKTLEKVPSPILQAISIPQFWMRFSYFLLGLGLGRLRFSSAH